MAGDDDDDDDDEMERMASAGRRRRRRECCKSGRKVRFIIGFTPFCLSLADGVTGSLKVSEGIFTDMFINCS